MENPHEQQPTSTDDQFWTDLGLKYEAAFRHDSALHNIIHKYLHDLPPTAHILDCGTGTGKPVAKAITDSGRHVHGIDRSAGMISLCRTGVPRGTFTVANMLDYAAADGSYEGAVASLSTFELSRAEMTTMAGHWFRWLRPGGRLLINTFAAEACSQATAANYDADGECATRVEWIFMGNLVPITLFTKAGWKVLLETAGFEIVYTEDDLFHPRADARCDPEPHYYIIAEKASGSYEPK